MNTQQFIVLISALMSLLIVFGASVDCEEEIKVKAPVVLILWAFVYLATSGLLFTIHAFMPKS